MASHDPQTRHLVSRIGAEISWANTEDRAARTAPARAGLNKKFLDEASGDPVRAEHLRRAHFLKLALMSAEARKKIKHLTAEAEAAGLSCRVVVPMPLPEKRTSPVEGTGPAPKNTIANEALGVDLIITLNAPDPYCGRCGGVSGPEGAWCDNCIQECREYTLLLDLKREAA